MTRNTADDDIPLLHRTSEIIFMSDAKDSDPNGDPLSSGNKPRIDPVTNQAVVTDVRLKRYLRDQLDDDGHGVYIHNRPTEDGYAQTRSDLVKQCVDITDPAEVDDSVVDELLSYAADIRLFGALFSLQTDDDELADALADALPSHYEGPVQFSPGRSLHPVQLNEESRSLSSVIGTDDEKETGGFGLNDYRIRYGVISFHGVANASAATNTNITETDVERLDTLMWRAMKNQTNTRSKRGQEPRLYLRVEYEEDSYHVGLADLLDVHGDDCSIDEARSITDVVIEADNVIDMIAAHADRIKTVHVNASELLTVEVDGETGNAEFLYDAFRDAVGDDSVHVIDVYDEYPETLPDTDDTDGETDDTGTA